MGLWVSLSGLPLSDEGPQWQECANTGHWSRSCRTGLFDPELPSEIGAVNGRKARQSGLRLKTYVAPIRVARSLAGGGPRPDVSGARTDHALPLALL
jgi:hypothetical protein